LALRHLIETAVTIFNNRVGAHGETQGECLTLDYYYLISSRRQYSTRPFMFGHSAQQWQQLRPRYKGADFAWAQPPRGSLSPLGETAQQGNRWDPSASDIARAGEAAAGVNQVY